jgi:hypothetical protein
MAMNLRLNEAAEMALDAHDGELPDLLMKARLVREVSSQSLCSPFPDV